MSSRKIKNPVGYQVYHSGRLDLEWPGQKYHWPVWADVLYNHIRNQAAPRKGGSYDRDKKQIQKFQVKYPWHYQLI